jgi:hypothetical protein
VTSHGNKALRKLVRALEGLGWRAELTRRHHVVVFSPDGKHRICMSSSLDWRAARNVIADLRRCGVPEEILRL